MRILILNTSENIGGAAVAANRLMLVLQKAGIDASMLVRDKGSENPNVISINSSQINRIANTFRFIWEHFIIFLCSRLNRENIFKISIANTGIDVSRHPSVRDADIIHLHWINQGFLSLNDIERLSGLGKPVVWTMHDMWPCTAICHHARECKKYQECCRSCFFLHSSNKNDLSSIIFLKKKKIIEKADITFVTCSRWLSEKAKTSIILKNKQILTIPNPINISVFHPGNVFAEREKLNLPLGKKLILFGAVNITDKRKGIDYLIKAMKHIQRETDVELVIFGQTKQNMEPLFPFPVHYAGYIKNEQDMSSLYNAVDIYVTSSLEENLPNTIMESMACGTPCVGFNIGGIPDMIDHKQNGYVAEYKNPDDLAAGIQWLLRESDYEEVSKNARKKVEGNYREDIVAGKYIALYENLLMKNGKIF
ncbi:MAG: glycosyltransferase family 4 protein [Tannerella sp.]|jgi:glycosyltransferase involved in cell wall biosynthesis|nr:glycosyltransferase family 4 protein [Tannerella sp.]